MVASTGLHDLLYRTLFGIGVAGMCSHAILLSVATDKYTSLALDMEQAQANAPYHTNDFQAGLR